MIKDMSLEAATITSTTLNGDIVTSISSTTTLNSNIIGNNSFDAVINTTSSAVERHDSNNDALELTILCIKGIIFVTIILGAVLGKISPSIAQFMHNLISTIYRKFQFSPTLGNALVIISVHKNRKLR